MGDQVKITVEGVDSKEQMSDLLQAINDDLNDFDPYMSRVGGSVLTNFERIVIRSYLVWKVIKPKDEDIREVPN